MKRINFACFEDADNCITLFSLFGVTLLTFFTLYSGGELPALLAVVLLLTVAYKVVRYSLVEIHIEKLFFFTVGLYFAIVSIFGFTLVFFGLSISVVNFLLLALLAFIAVSYTTRGKTPCKVTINGQRLLFIGIVFILTFSIYTLIVPDSAFKCPINDHCLHIEYIGAIHLLGSAIPPIYEWRYYPSGFHINGALLTHAFEPFMSSYSNFIYTFTTFITALINAILTGILYDRLKKKIYTLIFITAILSAPQPISGLIQFGFWASIFGMYHVFIGVWMLSDFVKYPRNSRILIILVAIAAASILTYQVLASITFLLSFLITSLTLVKIPWMSRLKITALFFIILGIIISFYAIEEYSKYLRYTYLPVQTYDYVTNLSKDIDNIDSHFYYTANLTRKAIRSEESYALPGVDFPLLLSKGMESKNINDFLEIGNENMNGASGTVTFFIINWSWIPLLLMTAFGLVYSYGKRDYTLVFMEASLIHLFLFALAMNLHKINLYYYSKVMYLFIYPLILYAIVGVEELLTSAGAKDLLSRTLAIKKRYLVIIGLLLLMTAYSLKPPKIYNSYYPGMLWYGSDPALSHQIGRMDALGGWTSGNQSYGYLILGPHITLEPHPYKVLFELKVDGMADDSQKVGSIEVTEDNGTMIIAKDLYSRDFEARGEYRNFSLTFISGRILDDVEFRVRYSGSGVNLSLRQIALSHVSQLWKGSDSSLSHGIGREDPDGAWTSGDGGDGYMISGGPHITFTSGIYDISYGFAVDEPTDDNATMAIIELTHDGGSVIPLKSKGMVYGKDFNTGRSSEGVTYKSFTNRIFIENTLSDVEFKLYYLNGTDRVVLKEIYLYIRSFANKDGLNGRI